MRNFDLKDLQETEIDYPAHPEEDFSDNSIHFDGIKTLSEWLAILFYDQQDRVSVHGNHSWYPVEGKPKINLAPDVMVIFGRPQVERTSYVQHREGGIAPQVVFELGSPSNRPNEMAKKKKFYQKYGVEEYYWLHLAGRTAEIYIRDGKKLVEQKGITSWVSPRLGIRLDWSDPNQPIQIFNPDGTRMELLREAILGERERTRQEAERAQRLETELQFLRARLRERGIDPDNLT